MMGHDMTVEVLTNDTASCHICCARNYDATHPDSASIGERVDRLYKLRFDTQVVILCNKCCVALYKKLGQCADIKDEATAEAEQS